MSSKSPELKVTFFQTDGGKSVKVVVFKGDISLQVAEL